MHKNLHLPTYSRMVDNIVFNKLDENNDNEFEVDNKFSTQIIIILSFQTLAE